MNTMSQGAVKPSATSTTRICCRPTLTVNGSPAFGIIVGAAGG
jgi:hypothetical protein